MKKLSRKKGGFTLVELLVVLAILAVLIAVAVPTLTGVLKDAKDKTFLQQARTAYVAYEYLRMEKDNVLRTDIQEMLDIPADKQITVFVKYADEWEGPITDFWYHGPDMTRETYVHVPLGGKAKIVERNEEGIFSDGLEADNDLEARPGS